MSPPHVTATGEDNRKQIHLLGYYLRATASASAIRTVWQTVSAGDGGWRDRAFSHQNHNQPAQLGLSSEVSHEMPSGEKKKEKQTCCVLPGSLHESLGLYSQTAVTFQSKATHRFNVLLIDLLSHLAG